MMAAMVKKARYPPTVERPSDRVSEHADYRQCEFNEHVQMRILTPRDWGVNSAQSVLPPIRLVRPR
jgi:hypothetical protein